MLREIGQEHGPLLPLYRADSLSEKKKNVTEALRNTMISGKTIWSLWNSLLQEFLQEQYKPRQYKGYFLYLVKCSIIKEAQTTVADTLGSLIFRDNFHKSETGELGPAKKSPWNLKAKVITVHFLSKCFSATLCFSDLYYWKEKTEGHFLASTTRLNLWKLSIFI